MRVAFLFTLFILLGTAKAQDSAHFEFSPININTPKAEMTPYIYRKGILFARSGEINEKEKQRFLDIYYAVADSQPTQFSKASPLKGKVNEVFHEAALTLVGKRKMLFTRNSIYKGHKKTTKKGVLKLDIFEATLNDEGEWTDIKPFVWNNKEYSVGHPTWSAKEKRLYFASDMPGGIGGIDLYYSKWDGDKWLEPRNLGKNINSEKDEMFPTIAPNQSLYFASDRAGGSGGLDLYVLWRDTFKLEWDSSAQPLSGGFNTAEDDFGITFNQDMRSGYFTSSRVGRQGSDDIYFFKFIEPTFVPEAYPYIAYEMTVFNQETKVLLPNTKIVISNPATGENWIFFTDSNGRAVAQLDTTILYKIELEKADYFAKKIDKVKPTVNGAQIGLVKLEVNKSYEVENIYYDLDKSDIRPDAAENLGELIQLLLDNPVKIELGAHTDARGNEKYNLQLSQARAKSAVAYIVSKGIDPNRVIAKGYGATQLVNKCKAGVACTEEEHQQNRRTEFKILEISK